MLRLLFGLVIIAAIAIFSPVENGVRRSVANDSSEMSGEVATRLRKGAEDAARRHLADTLVEQARAVVKSGPAVPAR